MLCPRASGFSSMETPRLKMPPAAAGVSVEDGHAHLIHSRGSAGKMDIHRKVTSRFHAWRGVRGVVLFIVGTSSIMCGGCGALGHPSSFATCLYGSPWST